jgi:hypothetical protein
MKLQIIETPDYILAVSDEEVKENDLALIPGYVGIVVVGEIDDMPYSKPHRRWYGLTCDTCFDVEEVYQFQKVIAYQPKGNAPELDLPLLPEIVVEDYSLEKAKKFAYSNFENLKDEYPLGKGMITIQDIFDVLEVGVNCGYKFASKAATKAYSEGDLRNAINMGIDMWMNSMTDNSAELTESDYQQIIQSLKQPKTPKWFVAKMEEVCRLMSADIVEKENWTKVENSKSTYQRLKTTTINGKTYLSGTYLYE